MVAKLADAAACLCARCLIGRRGKRLECKLRVGSNPAHRTMCLAENADTSLLYFAQSLRALSTPTTLTLYIGPQFSVSRHLESDG